METRRIEGAPITSTVTYYDGRSKVWTGPAIPIDYLTVITNVKNGNHVTPNPFEFTKVTSTGLQGSVDRIKPYEDYDGYKLQTGGFASRFNNAGFFDSTVDAPKLNSLYASARQSALDRLTSAVRGDLDVSIDLLQPMQFRGLVEDLWGKTRHLAERLDILERRLKRGHTTWSKEISDLWLTYVFGIKPTVETIYGLIEKLNADAASGQPLVRVRARGSSSDTWVTNTLVAAFSWVSAPLPVPRHASARCSFDVLLKPNSTFAQKAGEYATLNPVSWAWELVRFSFVFDYFVDLGSYLRNLETFFVYGNRFHSGTETRTTKLESIAAGLGAVYPPEGQPSAVWRGFTGNHTFKHHKRAVMTSYPAPRLPVLDPDLGATRVANIVALLLQAANSTVSRGAPRRRPDRPWWETIL